MRVGMWKKITSLLLCAVLLLGTVPVAQGAHKTDYYVTVVSPDGIGVNMRAAPDRDSEIVLPEPIPLHTQLHITRQQNDAKGRPWGLTSYEGISGWVYLKNETSWNGEGAETPEMSSGEHLLLWPDQIPAQTAAIYYNKLRAIERENGGFVGGKDPMKEYLPSELPVGPFGAILFDLDEDGSPELYTLDSLDECVVEETIWTIRNGEAVELHKQRMNFISIWDTNITEIVRCGGRTYYRIHGEDSLGMGEGEDSMWGDWYALENGQWNHVFHYCKITDGMSPEGEQAPPSIELEENGAALPADRFDEMMSKYQPSEGQCLFFEGAGYPSSSAVGISELYKQLQAAAMAGASGTDALKYIAYLGDPSICKMDVNMAEAYAKVLDEQPESEAVLLDIAGDGYPLLCTVSGYDPAYGGKWDKLQIWEYRQGKAVEYDFLSDYPTGGEWVSSYRAAGSHLEIEFNDGGAPMPHYGAFTYEVKKGRLKQIESYTRDFDIQTGRSSNCMINGEPVSEEAYLAGLERRHSDMSTTIATAMDMSEFLLDLAPAAQTAKALRAYAKTASRYSYPCVEKNEDQFAEAVTEAAAAAAGGEVESIYKLDDGLYYVVITADDSQKGVLVTGVTRKGEIVWQAGAVDDTPLTPEELEARFVQWQSAPNIRPDFTQIGALDSLDKAESYLSELLEDVDGLMVNDAGKRELGSFAESVVANLSASVVSGRRNRLTVTGKDVEQAAKAARKNADALESTLKDGNVTLNKPITMLLRVVWNHIDPDKPCQVTLDETLLEVMDGCTLQLLLGDEQHSIQLDFDALSALIDELDTVTIQFSLEDDICEITFLNTDGEPRKRVDTPVLMELPADSATNTVMLSYAEGSDNWGGWYDPVKNTISFETCWSGEYEVLENSAVMGDVADLPQDTQQAIAFLVSKGYMTLDGQNFDPEGSLSRYDFTRALVGMFFALDRTKAVRLPDVPRDSLYYPYVASAQRAEIVEELPDGTFGGEKSITVEQMLAFAGNTLADRRGYGRPEDPAQYLSVFEDGESVSDGAAPAVALSIREGLVDPCGELLPQSDISREQAAVILYRLFLLLHETSPVVLELPEAAEQSVSPVVIAAGAGAVVVAAAAIVGVVFWKKKKAAK